MSEQQDEQNDVQRAAPIKMLQQLLEKKQITEEQFSKHKEKYIRLSDAIQKIFQHQKVLPSKYKKITQDVKFKKEEFDQANIRNDESENQVKKAQSEVKKAENEEESLKKALDQLELEYQVQNSKNEDQENKIKEQEKDLEELNKPRNTSLQQEIDTKRVETEHQRKQIEEKEKEQKMNQERISKLKKDNDNIIQELEAQKEEKANIQGRPIQYQKEAERRRNAYKQLTQDLEKSQENIKKENKAIDDMQEKKKKRSAKNDEVDEKNNQLKQEQEKLEKETQHLESEIKQWTSQIAKEQRKKGDIEQQLGQREREIKIELDNLNSIRKLCQRHKQDYKVAEKEIKELKDRIRELDMSIDKYQKEEKELKLEIQKLQEMDNNIDEDNSITEYKKRTVEKDTQDKQKTKEQLEQQNQEFENQLSALQEFENSALKKVKMLTAMRESMARKASSAMAEVRETREELKIKELLILDLTKKHQETEFKLNSFKALYEEVKSARNKYVNLIQNSSQHSAELKERIKILQNELEILKNESQEKSGTLIQYKHLLQQEIHKRDRVKQKLNKRNFSMRSKKQQVDQNINEIEKLNMIIMAIEKEILVLRKQYEQACESRNYTGIQLIDRNDELCILYEKSNIQEKTLKNGEQEIKKLEDEVRMIKIEINEKKRQIDVARKQILQVPILADKVIELKETLEKEQREDQRLSELIENPENTSRWRELKGKGEEPDAEALEANIHQIEERLNNKKEQLLEKELILDEITNLSEKLRKQALEGRQNTLELSEKLNSFQARLKDITRKTMASISELAMFQSTEIKLQQERDQLDSEVNNAKERISNGLPPTPESDIEYYKMERDNKRYLEEKQVRMQREALDRNFPPFAKKTTAVHRVNAYVPQDLAIPKPYGKHAPFQPSEQGANMRHFKKPVIKEIEI